MFSDQALGLKVDGLIALSPDMGYNLPFNGESYSVEEPIVEDNVVKGVFGKNEKGEEEKIRGKITIDALRIASLLRRKLPIESLVLRT